MYLRSKGPDVGSVLAELASNVKDRSNEVNIFLDHIGKYEVFNPFHTGALPAFNGIDEPIGSKFFWERLGICHLISNSSQNVFPMEDDWHIENRKNDTIPFGWQHLKNDAVIDELKTVISGCTIIQFADWANVDDASNLWNGFYCDVIKPLNKRDFQFIFHIGDTTKKLVFEVDEILDIISDYSSYGRVTLVLEKDEADKLWCRLGGQESDGFLLFPETQGAKEKYFFLFNTMHIDALLILHSNDVMLFSRDWQFDLIGKALDSTQKSMYAWKGFETGYQLGLLLNLKIPLCIALGLAVAGIHSEHTSPHDSKVLLSYINDWMAELLARGCSSDMN